MLLEELIIQLIINQPTKMQMQFLLVLVLQNNQMVLQIFHILQLLQDKLLKL